MSWVRATARLSNHRATPSHLSGIVDARLSARRVDGCGRGARARDEETGQRPPGRPCACVACE
eukprot:2704627-Prymnesium_polylepis.2